MWECRKWGVEMRGIMMEMQGMRVGMRGLGVGNVMNRIEIRIAIKTLIFPLSN